MHKPMQPLVSNQSKADHAALSLGKKTLPWYECAREQLESSMVPSVVQLQLLAISKEEMKQPSRFPPEQFCCVISPVQPDLPACLSKP
jgi:hypothetical protein